ncbi:RING finger protein 4 [Periophthalmus magnuspinnatus]|uniref:RING finger protein 4 n=1 Tax=Periophthalmus magnuspinnatus TaxID=409849 RepID=UPI00145A2980|nr:RING finger protein 4 [Periophthalmus magnuspinnatus]
MKTSSERLRRRPLSSPSRPRSRTQSRPSPRSKVQDRTNKTPSRTKAKSWTTMNESPPSDTINLDSSNEDGPAEPVFPPVLSPGLSPGPGPGPDVVDLTSPTCDPAAVVDLTNDTVLVLDEEQTQSYVLSSDEEELTVTGSTTTSTAPARRREGSAGVHISCPVCMDSYFEIVDSGRLLVSTRCGHVFCSICLRDSLSQSQSCPICRKKLPRGHYHPIHL